MSHAGRRPILCGLFLTAACAVGCESLNRSTQPAAAAPPPTEDSGEQFFAIWNANAARIQSLKVDNVIMDVTADGKPLNVDAQMAFAQPHNLRLRAYGLGSLQADVGSNPEEVWFWFKQDNAEEVTFCKRDQLADVRSATGLDPNWLLEIMGVQPIDRAAYQPGQTHGQFQTFVSTQQVAGRTAFKRLLVDRRDRRLRGVELFDDQKRMVAKLGIEEYHEDPSGIFLPKKFRLTMPQANAELSLNYMRREIEINGLPAGSDEMFHGRGQLDTQRWVNVSSKLPGIGDLGRQAVASQYRGQGGQGGQGGRPGPVDAYEQAVASRTRPAPYQPAPASYDRRVRPAQAPARLTGRIDPAGGNTQAAPVGYAR